MGIAINIESNSEDDYMFHQIKTHITGARRCVLCVVQCALLCAVVRCVVRCVGAMRGVGMLVCCGAVCGVL